MRLGLANHCTMLNQNRAIFYLRRFLQEDLQLTALDGILIDVIIKMCNLILKNNYFYYDNNYCHRIKGGAMKSSLTLSLAIIYMKYWEKDLVEYQQPENRFVPFQISEFVFYRLTSPTQAIIRPKSPDVVEESETVCLDPVTSMIRSVRRSENRRRRVTEVFRPAAAAAESHLKIFRRRRRLLKENVQSAAAAERLFKDFHRQRRGQPQPNLSTKSFSLNQDPLSSSSNFHFIFNQKCTVQSKSKVQFCLTIIEKTSDSACFS
ncbi:unnamed protein product [Didymodactylos carnosus]|uniref:Uncharacterized protein n=1 Tax=Didymodactylos carnosus TaxID=1234261 RepID=A0A814MFN8_9BILA|nr:unnamed protein product [Didymodactylos carnosus]CAF3845039.1 unnamed protein product [Didymodactylos carnosus]